MDRGPVGIPLPPSPLPPAGPPILGDALAELIRRLGPPESGQAPLPRPWRGVKGPFMPPMLALRSTPGPPKRPGPNPRGPVGGAAVDLGDKSPRPRPPRGVEGLGEGATVRGCLGPSRGGRRDKGPVGGERMEAGESNWPLRPGPAPLEALIGAPGVPAPGPPTRGERALTDGCRDRSSRGLPAGLRRGEFGLDTDRGPLAERGRPL